MHKQKKRYSFTELYTLLLSISVGFFVLVLSLTNLVSTDVFAQNIPNLTSSTQSTSLNQIELLDQSARDAQINTLNESQIRGIIREIESDITTLQSEADKEKTKINEITQTLDNLNQLKLEQEGDQEIINNLDSEISKNKLELVEAEANIIILNNKIKSKQELLAITNQRLTKIRSEAEEASRSLQKEAIDIFSRYSFYFGLILVYFALLQLFRKMIDKFVQKNLIKSSLILIINSLFIIATVVTLFIAFIGNLSYLLASLGVISAALVVALQDFVSSIFAFFWIRIKKLYKVKDVISVNTGNTGAVAGIVINIGLLRTELREIESVDPFSVERQTGRVVSMPNNTILRAPVINYTLDNRILWHSMTLVVTFESNYILAKELILGAIKSQFRYALDHKDTFLDSTYNVENLYAPKVYMHIGNNGPTFTIWFASRFGSYNEVRESISMEILKSFSTHGIDLAYNTNRVIATPKNPEDTSTIAFQQLGLLEPS